MTPEQLAAIEARANAASKPPWRWDGSYDLCGKDGTADTYQWETSVLSIGHDGGCACRRSCQLEVEIADPDADFIAHARADVPDMAVEINRLWAVVAAADTIHHRHEHDDTCVLGLWGDCDWDDVCDHCEQDWPCLTHLALHPEEEDR